MKLEILNGYCGLGGNRRNWGTQHNITAVDNRPDILQVYAKLYPDACHIRDLPEFLLEYYHCFDFIWLSPPCPSHSRSAFWAAGGGKARKPFFADMQLYQVIIFLQHWFKGKWVVENVIPYYKPLIEPTAVLGRHLIWSNFDIPPLPISYHSPTHAKKQDWINAYGVDLTGCKMQSRKDTIYRNCTEPELGEWILNAAISQFGK